MFGFKRKNEENSTTTAIALIPKKRSLFTKLISFFKRNKKEEFYGVQSFYSVHSYIINAVNSLKEEVYNVTVDLDAKETFYINNIKEIGIIKHKENDETKVIVADYKLENTNDNSETNLRKVCFEIPTNYTLEEFLTNDGLYELIKATNLKFNELNFYKVNVIGRANIEPSEDGKIQILAVGNYEDTKEYVDTKLTENWLNQIEKNKKKTEEIKQKEDIEQIYNAPQTSTAFAKEEEKKENRINDNNIRVAPGNRAIYFTDPDNGKTIFLDELTKVNSVVHGEDSIANLYITNYEARKEHVDQDKESDKEQLAFELTDEDMNELLKNDDESLNLAFRTLFSETNVGQYKGSRKLGSKHIGYLKKTIEGYKILLGCNSSKNYLDSLNLKKFNPLKQTNGPISVTGEDNK